MDSKADNKIDYWFRYWVNRSYNIPVLGYCIRILTAVVNLPHIIRNINDYQTQTDARLAGNAECDEAMRAIVNDHRYKILDLQLSHEHIKSLLGEEDHILDSMYISFEDRFRGARDDIKRKLRIYLPLIDRMASGKENVSILDLGCGSGEWLELLQENGYRPKGIEVNRVAILRCREFGLDVTESDVIKYLKSIEKGSIDVITGFHIIEHLSFSKLNRLFEEAFAVLKSSGMIILETPNPTNILVSTYDFYRDPGHIRPLHPDTINFIAEFRGFVNTGSFFVSDAGSDRTLIKSTEWKLDDISDYIRAPRDYALIGYKP